jgi:hypothetical protein
MKYPCLPQVLIQITKQVIPYENKKIIYKNENI